MPDEPNVTLGGWMKAEQNLMIIDFLDIKA